MFSPNSLKTPRRNLVYELAAAGFLLSIVLHISCSPSGTQQPNSQVRSDNANLASPPQPTASPTPERRVDQTALNLVRVIHRWCDYRKKRTWKRA